MTENEFYENWHKDCLKDGVLTIPEEIGSLDESSLCKGDREDIRKVILPRSGVDISNDAFASCINLEELENFPPAFHYDEYFLDEETGEYVHLVEDRPCDVSVYAFRGCINLYTEKQRKDEDGAVWLDLEGKSYYISAPKATRPFFEEMCTYITKKFLDSGLADMTAFSFHEKIRKYGVEYEYLFENGALYNKTNGTWILFLSQYSNKRLVIPEWVKEYVHYAPSTSRRLDIKSLQFLGGTDLDTILPQLSDSALERIEFSHEHSLFKSLTLHGFSNLVEVKFGNSNSTLENNAFAACSNLTSLTGLEGYTIYGGAIFHQGHIVSVLANEVRYPEASEWLDDCWVPHTLYLPKSIKSVESNQNFKDDYERGWKPTYLHVKTIIVPAGYKDYFLNLFWENLQTYEGWFGDVSKEELEAKITESQH